MRVLLRVPGSHAHERHAEAPGEDIGYQSPPEGERGGKDVKSPTDLEERERAKRVREYLAKQRKSDEPVVMPGRRKSGEEGTPTPGAKEGDPNWKEWVKPLLEALSEWRTLRAVEQELGAGWTQNAVVNAMAWLETKQLVESKKEKGKWKWRRRNLP